METPHPFCETLRTLDLPTFPVSKICKFYYGCFEISRRPNKWQHFASSSFERPQNSSWLMIILDSRNTIDIFSSRISIMPVRKQNGVHQSLRKSYVPTRPDIINFLRIMFTLQRKPCGYFSLCIQIADDECWWSKTTINKWEKDN